METLDNKYSQQRITRLFKSALALSNISLGQIIGDTVRVSSFELKLAQKPELPISNGFLLEVTVFGNIEGIAHLLIDDKSATHIFENCLEMGTSSESFKDSMMREGLLSEIANMVVSAFITEIADQLEFEIYSNVPRLSKVDNFSKHVTWSENRNVVAAIGLNGKDSDVSLTLLLQFPDSLLNYL